jgi:alkylation response protein AidB-like acyl-CoA dehydrogenase
MDFQNSDEQVMLRDGARRFLDEQCSTDRVREVMESPRGYDADLWKKMAEQGWTSMHIPEKYGGAGFSFAETAILLHEMGRSLAPVPFLSSVVLAAEAILRAGSEDQKTRWLPGIASGDVIATLAVAEPGLGWREEGVATVASPAGNGYELSGTKAFVTDAPVARLFIVAARDDDGVGLYSTSVEAVAVEPVVSLDSTRPLGTVTLTGAPAEHLVAGSWETVEHVFDVAAVGLAAEQVGGIERVLEMAVQYAKDRKQFGRAIGSFQAIKHMCADMLVSLESARSAAGFAVWALATGSDEVSLAAPLAKAYCSEAYFKVAADNIQLHGGIGFTWEHDAHLYFKRAKSTELLLGSPAGQRELLANRLGL